MSETALANTTGFLFSALTLAGATGVTAQDVQGFVTVIGAIVTAACFIWSHVSHRSAISAATGSAASTS